MVSLWKNISNKVIFFVDTIVPFQTAQGNNIRRKPLNHFFFSLLIPNAYRDWVWHHGCGLIVFSSLQQKTLLFSHISKWKDFETFLTQFWGSQTIFCLPWLHCQIFMVHTEYTHFSPPISLTDKWFSSSYSSLTLIPCITVVSYHEYEWVLLLSFHNLISPKGSLITVIHIPSVRWWLHTVLPGSINVSFNSVSHHLTCFLWLMPIIFTILSMTTGCVFGHNLTLNDL